MVSVNEVGRAGDGVRVTGWQQLRRPCERTQTLFEIVRGGVGTQTGVSPSSGVGSLAGEERVAGRQALHGVCRRVGRLDRVDLYHPLVGAGDGSERAVQLSLAFRDEVVRGGPVGQHGPEPDGKYGTRGGELRQDLVVTLDSRHGVTGVCSLEVLQRPVHAADDQHEITVTVEAHLRVVDATQASWRV